MIQTVKLSKLVLSDINVRRHRVDKAESFAASIAANGILQNLIVTPLKKPRGHFGVVAGESRYRGLMLLAERGEIKADDYDVPVMLMTGAQSELSEVSLVENFQRDTMNPADECRGFQLILAQGGDIDALAKRFHVTRRFVEGRLRLANLADPIFEALAEEKITLELAKAYGSTGSQERQLMVWKTYGHEVAGKDLGQAMIAAGLAMPATSYLRNDLARAERYVAAFEEAQRRRIGAHDGYFIDPAKWRRGERLSCEARAGGRSPRPRGGL